MQEYWKYKRGSEWRKWDLQVGTNKYGRYKGLTLVGDELEAMKSLTGLDSNKINSDHKFLSNEEYAKIFVEFFVHFSSVSVIAITNHNSGDGIHEIINYLDSKKDYTKPVNIYNQKSILPGVEIGGVDKAHVLVIFNPETKNCNKFEYNIDGKTIYKELDWKEYIEKFLDSIDIPNKRFIDSKPSNSSKLGVKDIIEKAPEWDFIPIFPHIDNSSGIWKELQESNKKELYESSFFGIVDVNPETNNTNLMRILNGKHISWGDKIVAVIQTSDAYSIQTIGNRFTWIKADPTFEGLKQIIYEPEDRVKIQPIKPDTKNERHVISEIKFFGSDSLFGNQKILLNENLNAIIGGKSSGKTLLLHSMADSIDPEQVKRIAKKLNFEGYSFIGEEYDFEVTWKNEGKDILSDDNPDNKTRKIAYIPQLYINYLAEKNNKEELNSLIGNILLQDGVFKIFFEEKTNRISNLSKNIESELTNLLTIRNNAIELNKKIKEVGASKTIENAIKKLEKQISDGQKLSNLSPDEVKSYNGLIKDKEELEKQLRLLKTKTTVLKRFTIELLQSKNDLIGFQEDENQIYQKGQLDKILDEFIEVPKDIQNIKALISKDFETLINNLQSEISKLKLHEKLETVDKELEKLNKDLSPFLKKIAGQKELKKLTEQLGNEKQKKTQSELLEKQFSNSVEEYRNSKKRITDLLKERHTIYKSIVTKVNETKSEIGEEITLHCSLIYKKEKFLLFEQANKAAIAQDHFFNELFSENIVNYELIPDIFHSLTKVSEDYLYFTDKRTIPLKQKISIDEIFRGIILDNFEFDYKVTYKNDELLRMSPGKKGTVLLILFLQISSAEYPILIDQPEDNLDNRTIYDLLCKIIKEKKIDRQIIIVSHNANLVVATDSENIIVANQEGQDPLKEKSQYRFEYVNGAMEFSLKKDDKIKGILYQQGIKEHVCDILEGGNEAFKKRERKYALK